MTRLPFLLLCLALVGCASFDTVEAQLSQAHDELHSKQMNEAINKARR